MKSVSALAVCVTATLVGLSACANPGEENRATQAGSKDIVASVQKDDRIAAMLPDDVRKRGITISINPDVEPVKFVDKDGHITGLNPELLRAAAKVLGTKAVFQQGTFDAMVPGLESKRYDLIASIGDYVERQKRIDFIDYLRSGDAILASDDFAKDTIKTGDLCGLDVGYARGTSQQGLVEAAAEKCAEEGKPKLETSAYGEAPAGVLAVRSGQDDAFWGDLPSMAYNAKRNPDLYKVVYKAQDSVYGIGVHKDNTELRDALRAALLKLVEDGAYDRLLEQWGQQGSGVPKLPINSDNRLED